MTITNYSDEITRFPFLGDDQRFGSLHPERPALERSQKGLVHPEHRAPARRGSHLGLGLGRRRRRRHPFGGGAQHRAGVPTNGVRITTNNDETTRGQRRNRFVLSTTTTTQQQHTSVGVARTRRSAML